jgi:class 3 adenylate cyclase
MTNPRKPSTRGFLFADLRGYTAFVEAHGDGAARELLQRYRTLVRREIAAFDGSEIRTEGDSFYVVFEAVADAVKAGLAIRDAATEPGEDPIRVGVGIHAGEVTDGDEGIVSSAVNIAARLCAVAGPGEVLVTDTVRALIRTATDVQFAPRGRRHLKGIAEPVALFAAGDRATRHRVSPRVQSVGLIALLALLAVAVGAGIVLLQGDAPAAGAPSPTPATTPSADGPSFAPSPPSPDAFPNAAETDLLDRLPSEIAASCERADPANAPSYSDSVRAGIPPRLITYHIPVPITAGLSCLTQITRLTYWESSSASDVDAMFTQRIAKRSVPRGTCEEGQTTAWETWESATGAGRLVCSAAPGGSAALEWTYDDMPIYVAAVRRDGDLGALLAWWRQIGRHIHG